MSDQANILRGLMERRQFESAGAAAASPGAACTIAVTSGKGGVGKSNVALNVGLALAEEGARVCLLDANLGLGNIDLLCGLNGYWNLAHVVTGARRLKDVVLDGPAGLHVVPGASGLVDLADCSQAAQDEIFRQLEELERTHDFIILDTGTGIHQSIRRFLAAADVVLVVTAPEPTAIADAYATVKSLAGADESLRLQILVNQAESAQQARAILDRFKQTARTFLRRDVESAGFIPFDPHVPAAVRARRPLLHEHPECPAATAIRQLARRLKSIAASVPARPPFFARLARRASRKAA
ncbi:MAG: MinD/ParA family protein [Planctomycetales bacterium]